MQDYLMIGTVLRPQGLRGECKIRPYAADLKLFARWTTLYLSENGGFTPLSCRVTRIHEGFVYARLGDCASPEDAERLRGRDLYVDRAHAAPPEENGHLIADLVGCRAVTPEGRELGELTDVLQYGSVDTYVFKTPRGTMMAPALLAVFPVTDVEQRVLHVCAERLAEVAVYED